MSVITILAGCSHGAAADLYPVSIGNTWTYEVTEGSVIGTNAERIAAVASLSGGKQVTMTGSLIISGFQQHATSYFFFGSDGSMTIPPNDPMTSLGWPSLPDNIIVPPLGAIQPGRSFVTATNRPLNYLGKNTSERQSITLEGDGVSRITLPAGTYQATAVTITIVATLKGKNALTTMERMWFAPGVGLVKEQVDGLAPNGRPGTELTEELESFKHG